MHLAFFQNVGMPELIIILVIILIVFGASRVPAIARSLGKSAGEFKKGLKEGGKGEGEDSEDEEASPKD